MICDSRSIGTFTGQMSGSYGIMKRPDEKSWGSNTSPLQTQPQPPGTKVHVTERDLCYCSRYLSDDRWSEAGLTCEDYSGLLKDSRPCPRLTRKPSFPEKCYLLCFLGISYQNICNIIIKCLSNPLVLIFGCSSVLWKYLQLAVWSFWACNELKSNLQIKVAPYSKEWQAYPLLCWSYYCRFISLSAANCCEG